MGTLAWTFVKGLLVAGLTGFFTYAIRYDLGHGMAPAAALLVMFVSTIAVSFLRGWPTSDFNPGMVALRRARRAESNRVAAEIARAGGDELGARLEAMTLARRDALTELQTLIAEARTGIPARRAARIARRRPLPHRRSAVHRAVGDALARGAVDPALATTWLAADDAVDRATWELHLLARCDACRLLRVGGTPLSVLERAGLEHAA